MSNDRILLLQAMPVFGGVRDDILDFLLQDAHSVHRDTGRYFLRQGERAGAMFVLERGRVEVLKLWSGREYFMKYFGPGDSFGEMALIDLFPRSASIRALEPSDALEVSHENLFRLYGHDLEQFAIIQMNIGREISRRMRELEERLFQTRVGGLTPKRAGGRSMLRA